MADIMSQSEIDALLGALNSGEVDVNVIKEVDTAKVKNYDFRNPQKISKEQLRTLEIIFENFGRSFQTFLTGHLRAQVKTTILTVDQFAYSEFSNAISNPAFLTIIDFKPLSGQILIDISPNIMFTIIDKVLGGEGEEKQEIRSFTEIELKLLERTMEHIVEDLKVAWENVVEVTPKLEKIETNPQFAQIVPPNETIALITMTISIGNQEGLLNICIPYILLEPIIDKLNTRFWFNTSNLQHSETEIEKLKDRILGTRIPLIAMLGKSTLSINEIANLHPGDVIKLNTRTDSKIQISVGSKIKFQGEVGRTDQYMAIKITDVVKDGDLKYE